MLIFAPSQRRIAPGKPEKSAFGMNQTAEALVVDASVTAKWHLRDESDVGNYDGLYLALAQQLHIPFITADNKLYQRIKNRSDVIWLGDYVELKTE